MGDSVIERVEQYVRAYLGHQIKLGQENLQAKVVDESD